MGVPVLIIGESGSGKSTSLRNFKCNEVGVFNVLNKPFPFRGELNRCTIQNCSYDIINKTFDKPLSRRTYIIDDSQYLMAKESFAKATEIGFSKFTTMAQNFYNLLQKIQTLPDDVIVFMLNHVDKDEQGRYRAKTLGKMIDNQLTLEGVFSIVLLARYDESGRYVFETQGLGMSTAKSPMGMFDEIQIDNDLKFVDAKIREYWGLKPIIDIQPTQHA